MIKREVVIGNCRLLLGDCLAVLPTLGRFDALVTDPPYEFETSGAGIFRAKRQNMDEIAGAGLNRGFDHSLINAEQFGSVVVFAHNDQWSQLLPFLAEQFERYVICQWHKTNPMPVANRHYQPDTEIYVHAWSSGHHPVGELREKRRYILAANGQDIGIAHPTVKPLQVMSKIIGNVNGETICDPFMGSGSTGVACVKMGRKFTGIEINETYFEIACDRIRAAVNAPDLFLNQSEIEKFHQEAMSL